MRAGFLLVLTALLAGGCAGYKLGPSNGLSSGSRTIQVAPFVNHTQDPRVSEYLATSMRKQLSQDGTFRLQTGGAPDILVTGEITKLDRSGLSYVEGNVLEPQEYTLVLQARITAKDVNTGKTLINRLVSGHAFLRITNDETSAERQAIPQLTDSLAQNAVSMLVDGSW